MTCFIDTNVLLYAHLTDPAHLHKQHTAREVLRRRDCVFSVQVMQEFYVQATRVNRLGGISHDKAVGLIDTWSRFRVENMTMGVLNQALQITARYHFSYWDSAIIAAALSAGCDTLYTEDMQHDKVISGMRIVNPFAAPPLLPS